MNQLGPGWTAFELKRSSPDDANNLGLHLVLAALIMERLDGW
jgi:hypothetical protein